MKVILSLLLAVSISSFAAGPKKFRFVTSDTNKKLFDLEVQSLYQEHIKSPEPGATLGNLNKLPPQVRPAASEQDRGTAVYKKGELVYRKNRKIGEARVEGIYSQSVYDKKGNLRYRIGAEDPTLDDSLKEKVTTMQSMLSQVMTSLKITNKDIREASHVFAPEVEVFFDKAKGKYRASWVVAFVDSLESTAWEYRFDENLTLIEGKQAAAHLIVGKGNAYPRGPGKSSVADVFLPNLVGDGTLTSNALRIITAHDTPAMSPSHKFYYQADDSRFDQVQAYYYMNIANNWFAERLGVILQTPVEVKVHVGGDRPSNAAFYFRNKIFLGAGDGRIYRDLIKDPTVVIHEIIHAYVDQLTGMDNSGSAGSFNEAMADYFSAAITTNPNVGSSSYLRAPFRRTLNNELKAFRDFRGKKYHDSTIISGTLWQLRKTLDSKLVDQLALRTLLRLGPKPEMTDFVPAVHDAMKAVFNAADQQRISQVLQERGWYTNQE